MKKQLLAIMVAIFVCMTNICGITASALSASEENALLDQINNASGEYRYLAEIIDQYRDVLGIDYQKYMKLNSGMQRQVCIMMYQCRPFDSMDQFRKIFNDAVSRVSGPSTPSSGGGSGGGGGGYNSGNITLYTLTSDKKVIEEQPENGTPVKLVVKAEYQGQEDVTYIVSVYNYEKILTAVTFYESNATQPQENEFFELDTVYNVDSEIRVLKVKDVESLEPIDAMESFRFEYGDVPPVREEEKEGVVAVRGLLENVCAESFELRVCNKRVNGYWVDVSQSSSIKINFCNPVIEMYRRLPTDDVVYNLVENEDGTYNIDSVDTTGEIISFTYDDIYSYSKNILSIVLNGEVMSYEVSLRIDLSNSHYMAYLLNGKIETFVEYTYSSKKVAGNSRDYIIFDDSTMIEKRYVEGEPAAGDVLAIAGNVGYKTDSSEGKFYIVFDEYGYVSEEYVLIDDVRYPSGFAYYEAFFAPGEACKAHFDPEGKYIICIEKLYDKKELLVIKDVAFSENGEVVLNTSNGDKKLTSEVYMDAMLIESENAAYLISENLPCVAYYSVDNNASNIETLGLYYIEDRAQYDSLTNTLGGYVIEDGNIAVLTSEGIFTDSITLKNNNYYRACYYSLNGTDMDYIIIDDPSGDILNRTRYIVVEGYFDGILSGYCDGEEISIEWNLDLGDVYPGDLISIVERNNAVISYKKIVTIENVSTLQQVFSNTAAFLPVIDVKDNMVTMLYNDLRKVCAIDSATEIYMFDMSNNILKKADTSDIFYNDWITVLKENTSSSLAKIIVIYKI